MKPIATKFVSYDVVPLEELAECNAYMLREKLNKGEKMNRAEKNWLAETIAKSTHFKTSIPLMGYRFDFSDVLKKYVVDADGRWVECYAPDKTSMRRVIIGKIKQIIEIPQL